MSVRTSSVVATGMLALAAIGLVTIFGGTIAAVVSPPTAAPDTSATAPAAPSGSPSVPAAAAAAASPPTPKTNAQTNR